MKTVLRSLSLAAFATSLALAPTALTLAAAKIVLPGGYTGSNHPAPCVLDKNGVGDEVEAVESILRGRGFGHAIDETDDDDEQEGEG